MSPDVAGPESDLELMLQVKKGDLASLEVLYRRHSAAVLNFLYHMCWDRELAEDYLQETFLRLWVSAYRYRPSGKFTTFLFQIAKNYYLNQRDKMVRRPKQVDLREDHRAAPDRDLLEQGELRQAIGREVEALPEPLKLVFVLAEYEGMRYREVGEILGIPEATVKSRMHRATGVLQRRLKKYAGRPK
jgi:RNA polymerase sigma-70 factor (ECF subfamily)